MACKVVLSAIALAAFVSLGGPAAVAAAAPVVDGAAAAVDPRPQKAKAAFNAGRYREALEIFVKLHAETSDPIYLRVIGRCYQRLEDPDRAIEAFQGYLRQAKRLAPDKRKEIESFIAEMEQLRKRRSADIASAPAAVAPPAAATAPSPPPSPVEAAPLGASAAVVPAPVPLASVPPAPVVSAPLVVASPASPYQPAPVAGDTEARPVYGRWWFWTAVGVAAVAGVVTGVLLARPDAAAPYMGEDGGSLLEPGLVRVPSQ